MLALVQRQSDITGEWADMTIPRNADLAPRRGEQPLVSTVEEFAAELIKHKLVGEYRVITSTGEVWRVSIIRRDEFVAETRLENPV
jgi:hypothetical protein